MKDNRRIVGHWKRPSTPQLIVEKGGCFFYDPHEKAVRWGNEIICGTSSRVLGARIARELNAVVGIPEGLICKECGQDI